MLISDSLLQVPHEYVCPITLDLMTRPTILLQSNQIYDFENIDLWLRKSESS